MLIVCEPASSHPSPVFERVHIVVRAFYPIPMHVHNVYRGPDVCATVIVGGLIIIVKVRHRIIA